MAKATKMAQNAVAVKELSTVYRIYAQKSSKKVVVNLGYYFIQYPLTVGTYIFFAKKAARRPRVSKITPIIWIR